MADDAVVDIDYYATLDDDGKEAVDAFYGSVDLFARRLEEAAAEVRKRVETVGIERLRGRIVVDKFGKAHHIAPSLELMDLLPDIGRVSDGVVDVLRHFVGNLPLAAIASDGREAHEAFRRAARRTGAQE